MSGGLLASIIGGLVAVVLIVFGYFFVTGQHRRKK
jgi:hypothetical protein